MRSITQRLGSTVKPFVPGGLLTTSTRRPTACAARATRGALVAPVAPDELPVGGAGFGLGQHRAGADRVLYRGRLHLHGQRQAFGVHNDRTLAARYWLARVVAVAAPLVPPVRTDCVSMAPAVGSAARGGWRTARRSPSSNRSQVPSSRHASNCW